MEWNSRGKDRLEGKKDTFCFIDKKVVTVREQKMEIVGIYQIWMYNNDKFSDFH